MEEKPGETLQWLGYGAIGGLWIGGIACLVINNSVTRTLSSLALYNPIIGFAQLAILSIIIFYLTKPKENKEVI